MILSPFPRPPLPALARSLAALVTAVMLTLPAAAQTMKPGLWEIRNRMTNNPQMDQAMAEMQKQLADPEAMKAASAAMRGGAMPRGMGLPGLGGGLPGGLSGLGKKR